MNKLLKYQWWIVLGLLIILAFTLLIGFHFYQEKTKVDVTKEPVVLPEDDELEFQNSSSLSNDEVWKLVQNVKEDLTHLFYDSSLYVPSDIDSSKTEEDDSLYVVFDDEFLSTLNSLVVEDIYTNIFNKMVWLKSDQNHQFYLAEKNIFESIYLDSSIAEVGITTSSFRLISATDEQINASVTVKACKEENDCSYETSFPFELSKIDDSWKVSAFQK